MLIFFSVALEDSPELGMNVNLSVILLAKMVDSVLHPFSVSVQKDGLDQPVILTSMNVGLFLVVAVQMYFVKTLLVLTIVAAIILASCIKTETVLTLMNA